MHACACVRVFGVDKKAFIIILLNQWFWFPVFLALYLLKQFLMLW